jgi:uncharacterized protein
MRMTDAEIGASGALLRPLRGAVRPCGQLHELIHDFRDAQAKAAAIKEAEHEADLVTHEIVKNLNMNFVTPIDREDIMKLATRLDDVLDYIEACSEPLVLYHIREPDSACRHSPT